MKTVNKEETTNNIDDASSCEPVAGVSIGGAQTNVSRYTGAFQFDGDRMRGVPNSPGRQERCGDIDERVTIVGVNERRRRALRECRDSILAQAWLPHLRLGRLARWVQESGGVAC